MAAYRRRRRCRCSNDSSAGRSTAPLSTVIEVSFGPFVHLQGACSDNEHKTQIAKLLRFDSSKDSDMASPGAPPPLDCQCSSVSHLCLHVN